MACWIQATANEASQKKQGCQYPQLHCDEDRCVEPDQMCDGTADCKDGVDESKGLCKE